MDVKLPEHINAGRLLPFLSLLDTVGDEQCIVLDFSVLRRVSPGALAALAAVVLRWKRERRAVTFSNVETCPIRDYLQRMDLFSVCGHEIADCFTRHESKGKFVPVRHIDHLVEEMSDEMASCLAPGGEDYDHPNADLYDLLFYVLSETGNNVRQHSRGQGYASAQATRKDGMVKLAIADNGTGILGSFQEAGMDHFMDDREAIMKALQSRVSSKGSPVNEGVGLTLVSNLARLMNGYLLVVSGRGVVVGKCGEPFLTAALPNDAYYKGTLLGLSFEEKKAKDFADLLYQAKINAGLLRESGNRGNFES